MSNTVPNVLLDIDVRTFCGQTAKGNRHKVFVLDRHDPRTFAQLQSLSEKAGVIVIGLSTEGAIPSAYFIYRGNEIKRCGSGNLACAFALNLVHDTATERQLNTVSGPVTLFAGKDLYGYQVLHSTPYIPTASIQLNNCFEVTAEQTILCGNETDYALLVYRREEDLKSLKPNYKEICQSTERALIATAPSDHPDYHYALRYFAPQWGNKEDAATGSAHVVAAPYWGKRLGLTELHSHQASREGGEFWVNLNHRPDEQHLVTLFGHCETE